MGIEIHKQMKKPISGASGVEELCKDIQTCINPGPLNMQCAMQTTYESKDKSVED